MRYVEVEGTRLSVIGLGTWQFGSSEWGYGKGFLDETAVAITARALDLGVNLIDTAELYGFGRSERAVGRAIAGRRDEAFVATKLFPVLPLPAIVERRARGSARRLGIATIDLYQLHWPNPVVPLDQPIGGLRRALDAGLVRHVGVSNFTLERWFAAEQALDGPVLSNQVSFSLVHMGPLARLIPYAETTGRVVIAYSPLAQGFLSTRYEIGRRPTGGVRAVNRLFADESIERAQPLFAALRRIAASHDATPAQVALAWVISHPNVVAIPGASSVEQLEQNAAAAELELSDDEVGELHGEAAAFVPAPAIGAVRSLARGAFARLPRD